LRRAVLDGNRAEDAVPRSSEARDDGLVDQDRSIRRDVNRRVEALDDERSVREDGRGGEQEERQAQRRAGGLA